jgi:hypothetical protein
VKFRFSYFLLFSLLFSTQRAQTQDLDPRAYVRIPIKTTLVGVGLGYSEGGILADPASPIQIDKAIVWAPSVFSAHVFNMFGKTAQVSAALPFIPYAEVTGSAFGLDSSITRSGFGDMRLRYSILLLGGDAATIPELMKAPRKTILGASLSVTAPTGQYFADKLINLGVHRWAFKPEIGLSQPVGKKWLVDVYAGVWFFTENNQFFPGDAKRTQAPLGSFQGHLSYNFNPRMWVALNTTFYTGGNSTVNGVENDDRQENSRIGGTFVFPVGKRHSIKTSYSRGAIIRSGANFTSLSLGWQMFFYKMPKAKPKTD